MAILRVLSLLSLVPAIALACSCVEPLPSERDSVRLGFCYYNEVYLGRLLSANCSCLQPTPNEYACQSYSFDLSSGVTYTTIAQSVCTLRASDHNLVDCSVATDRFSGDLIAQDATETLPDAVNKTDDDYCAYTCPFNSDDDDDTTFTIISMQPCIYALEIIEVFRSAENYTVGDIVYSFGPDVQTSCGQYDRILEGGETYVANIGGFCSGYREWSTLSEFGSDNLEYLRELAQNYNQNDPSTICGASTLTFLSSYLFFLTTAITVAVMM